MSEAPLPKKMKETDTRLSSSPERMNKLPKEVEEGPSKDQQQTGSESEAKETPQASVIDQYAEGEMHVFQFRIGYKKYKVACNTSQTISDALNESDAFKNHRNRHMNKEIIIQRATGKVPGAAVNIDFPCCLLKDDEILDISFIKNEGKISTNPKAVEPSLSKYKIFYIRTRGKIDKKIMQSNKLALKVDHVCVYGLKGETIKSALLQDGRFKDKIFNNPCELMDIFKDASYDISLPVDCLSEEPFEIYVRWQRPLNSANNKCKEEPADLPTADLGTQPINENQPQKKKKGKKGKPIDSLTKESMTEINWEIPTNSKILPSTQEILRDQCIQLFERLRIQEVQKLFQEEYGKSFKNFLEVSRMKELTKLSDSVCVIVHDKSAIGTGFLLFDRFILTNAHVVEEFLLVEDSDQRKLSVTLKAAFNYEHVTAKVECIPFKKELAAYCRKENDAFKHHDYALLELSVDKTIEYPRLLSFYKNTVPPKKGGIYIVGHPNSEIKKIDFCFIIETENQLQAINKHISENPLCPYVSWHCWPNITENKITYDTCLFHGSSGSPVFDEKYFLIGVHTGGYSYKDSNGETRSVIEYCYSMQSILESIYETGRPDVIELLKRASEENIPVNNELQQQEDQSMEIDS